MADKKEKFAFEFGKYERNILHAQAVNDVGGRVEYWVQDA